MLCVLSWFFWGLLTAVLFTYLTRAVVVGRRTVPVARDDRSRVVATVGAFAREFVLAALTVVSWPLGLVPIRIFSQVGSSAPIVLIPGAMMTWTACLPLRWFLRARVDNPIVLLGYTPLWGAPTRAAARLGDRVRTLARLAPGGRVHLIAFGEGGLTALGAMAADPELPVDRLVTVATPFVAPRMGRVFLPGGADRYPADLPALPAPTRAIRSAGDNLVLPDESLPPEGTDTVTFASDGHLSTWYSPRAWQRALEALDLEPPG